MTLKEAEARLLAAGIEDARAEARILFKKIGGLADYALVGISAKCESAELESALSRRERREPLQYILGEADFYRERYKVTPDCLIPRSDTEILVDYAVKNLPRGGRFLDLCCGSGCVGISVLNNTEATECVSLDISSAAVALTIENAQGIGVADRLTALCADVTSPEHINLITEKSQKFSAVLSNPPYVTSRAYEGLAPEIFHEPKAAFVGGEDGMDFYRAITPMYKELIEQEGFIAYEIGYDQAELIRSVADENQMTCRVINDLSGNPRVAIFRNPKN